MTEVNGEYENPPIHAPNIAGEPAISPSPMSFAIRDVLDKVNSNSL
jgi:hypothetical protein